MPHQMISDGTPESKSTYYEVLGLQITFGAGAELPAQQLKAAYRRAMLQHHPDKIPAKSEELGAGINTISLKVYTVDQIRQAYSVLSIPKLRSEYDRELKLKASSVQRVGQQDEQPFRTGFESVDLDDLSYDEKAEEWYRSCRCGDDRGFLVQEADLEEASEEGELHVGCRGCSLWLNVLFGVAEVTEGIKTGS